MSNPEDAVITPSQAPPAKPKVSPLRNVLGVILLIGFAGAAFVEFNARYHANAAIENLELALAAHKDGPHISRPEAEAIIGQTSTDYLTDPPLLFRVNYSWRGIFRRYVVAAEYRRLPDIYLVNVIPL